MARPRAGEVRHAAWVDCGAFRYNDTPSPEHSCSRAHMASVSGATKCSVVCKSALKRNGIDRQTVLASSVALNSQGLILQIIKDAFSSVGGRSVHGK